MNEMGKAYRILAANLKKRRHFEKIHIDGREILKLIL
jgi:hypothetical protein